jgi:zinc transport system substrate-binding protein
MRNHRLIAAGLAAGLLSLPGSAAAEPPEVVASIKPIHSLAAAVMTGVGAPALLVEGSASPHSYALRPSDAARLEAADIVFWIGPALESYLARPLAGLAADARVITLADLPGLVRHPPRDGGVWEPHEHVAATHQHTPDGASAHEEIEADAHEHEHDDVPQAGAIDPHLWLDPGNAQVIAGAMAEALAAVDQENAATYRANAAALAERIAALDAELAQLLAPVRDRPFVVFHDAYQYFETHYGLAAAGSITVSPEQAPGARRLAEIGAAIAARSAACVFREPQFEPALVELVVEGTGARQAELDPEGTALAAGPELYVALMRGLGRVIADCLGGSR